MTRSNVGRPSVFAKFLRKDILAEQGRLLFSLLDAFAESGYCIFLSDNIAKEDLGKYGIRAYELPNLELVDRAPADRARTLYLFDEQDRSVGRHGWLKVLQVRFDIFSPHWFGRPVLFPFPLHPAQTGRNLRERLSQYRSTSRAIRIFFSGDLKGYTKNRIQYPKAKLPRARIIDTILKRMGQQTLFVQDQRMLDDLFTLDHQSRCVIVDTGKLWIKEQEWLGYLARSHFFLAPPGIVMPMCHNIVEAMAVGAIPITNYPEWFNPKLEHLHNCIAFDDEDDLVAKLDLVLRMDDRQIAQLRELAVHYYDTYMTGASFTSRIESSTDREMVVLLFTERYVDKHADRLGKRSVLLRGTPPAGRFPWLGKFIPL